MTDLREDLFEKLELLNERLWEQKVKRQVVERWLKNFGQDPTRSPEEQIHALYLLSQFVYFGLDEVRELLRALFRDKYRYPIVAQFRRDNRDTTDLKQIEVHFDEQLDRTRFLGVGNPAESGTHLLYYFRQVNQLPKKLFRSELELVDRRYDDNGAQLSDPTIARLVFIDDFCGSGTQAASYSQKLLGLLRDIAKRSGAELHISYLVLTATDVGLRTVRENTDFDEADAVFVLDDSYKCLAPSARQFKTPPTGITQQAARDLARSYGEALWGDHPLGYKDGQLLLGFHHNVPDNTLPIIWWDESASWSPVFPRYHKIYV